MTSHALVRKNTFLGLFAVAIWSFAALLAVELTSIPTFELLFCEFLIAYLIVFARYSISKEKPSFTSFKKRDLLIASAALIANQMFYYSAFRHSPAAQVDLINYLWPTLLILFSSFLPNEKWSSSYLIACIFCLFGVYTLLSPGESQNLSSNHLLGYFLAFGAAVTWALYSLYSRYRGSSNSASCISWACGPAALVSLLMHLYFETFVFPNQYEIALILILGVFQMGLAFYFWERGLKKGCVKSLGLSSYSIPVFSVLLLVLFGKTDFEPRMITAAHIISLSPLFPLFADKFKPQKLPTIDRKQNSSRLAVLKSA
ncbi:MAG: EamA family transporter [Waddliaceae bacterium]